MIGGQHQHVALAQTPERFGQTAVEGLERRDIAGYAASLEAFDRRLPEVLRRLRGGDMLVLTADHGNDPSWRGTDHTRERVPIIGAGPRLKPANVGLRPVFADIGETVAEHLGLAPGRHGTSFYRQIAADA